MAKVYNAMLKPISPRRDVATLVFEKRDRHRRQPAVASPVDSKTRKTFLYVGLNTGSSSDGSYRGLSGPRTVYELAKIDTYRGCYSAKPLASIALFPSISSESYEENKGDTVNNIKRRQNDSP